MILRLIAVALIIAGTANGTAWSIWNPQHTPGYAVIMFCAGWGFWFTTSLRELNA